MNKETIFLEKLLSLLEKVQDKLSGDECAEIGLYEVLHDAENKLEELTYPE